MWCLSWESCNSLVLFSRNVSSSEPPTPISLTSMPKHSSGPSLCHDTDPLTVGYLATVKSSFGEEVLGNEDVVWSNLQWTRPHTWCQSELALHHDWRWVSQVFWYRLLPSSKASCGLSTINRVDARTDSYYRDLLINWRSTEPSCPRTAAKGERKVWYSTGDSRGCSATKAKITPSAQKSDLKGQSCHLGKSKGNQPTLVGSAAWV